MSPSAWVTETSDQGFYHEKCIRATSRRVKQEDARKTHSTHRIPAVKAFQEHKPSWNRTKWQYILMKALRLCIVKLPLGIWQPLVGFGGDVKYGRHGLLLWHPREVPWPTTDLLSGVPTLYPLPHTGDLEGSGPVYGLSGLIA